MCWLKPIPSLFWLMFNMFLSTLSPLLHSLSNQHCQQWCHLAGYLLQEFLQLAIRILFLVPLLSDLTQGPMLLILCLHSLLHQTNQVGHCRGASTPASTPMKLSSPIAVPFSPLAS